MMDDRKQKTPDVILPGERVQAVSLDSIHPFQGHPFKVREDADMEALKESIRTSGVITPAVVRPLPEGGYEMVSGHRRLAACRVLGLEKMPVIVREMDDYTATLMMVTPTDSGRRSSPVSGPSPTGCGWKRCCSADIMSAPWRRRPESDSNKSRDTSA